MLYEAHCQDSLKLFGDRFEQVHKWLDAYAGKLGIGMKHRRFRHHQEGIDIIKSLYGEAADLEALRHIKQDLKEDGWTERHRFPKNELDYVTMGLY